MTNLNFAYNGVVVRIEHHHFSAVRHIYPPGYRINADVPRAEGKPRQSLQIEHTPLGEAFERMNTAELEAYAVSGALPPMSATQQAGPFVVPAQSSPKNHRARRSQSLTTKQITEILEQARKASTSDGCMFLLTFRHALRNRGVRQLKLSDVNLALGTITINRVKGSNSSVQELDGHRGEPLLDSTLAIRLWLKERVEGGSQILFPSQKGGMLTRMQRLRLFKRYAAAARERSHRPQEHLFAPPQTKTWCAA